MVQIIDDPTHGSIFGRIGKGLGQGLAEQLPKEAERFRLSQGLQNLAQNAGNLTPLQQAAQYLPLLQNNPAALQILPQLLQQQGQWKGGPTPAPSSQPTPAPTSQNGEISPPSSTNVKEFGKLPFTKNLKQNEDFNKQFRALTNPEDIQRMRLPIMQEHELDARAHQLHNDEPLKYPTYESARKKAEAENASTIQQFDVAKQKRINDLNLQNSALSSLKNAYERLSQKKGDQTFEDVPGTADKVFDQLLLDQVSKGKTPEAAGEDVAEKKFEFARARSNMNNFGRESIYRASDTLVNDLKSAAQEYIKYNQQPLFVQDAQDKAGIGPHLASSIIYPKTSVLDKFIPQNSDKNIKSLKSDKVINNLAKQLEENPDSSIFALGMMLNDKKWDDGEVIKKLQDLATIGKFKPSYEQKLELDKYTPLNLTLGDLFNSAWMGITGKSKLPYAEAARRKFWGKR